MKYIYRSAITGKFVSKAYAEANPDTTVRQEIKPKPAYRNTVIYPIKNDGTEAL